MKIPTTSPDVGVLITKMIEKNSTELKNIFTQNTRPDPNGNYHYWDKLKYLKVPPKYKNQEHWWIGIKTARRALYNQISHNDKGGEPFVYGEPTRSENIVGWHRFSPSLNPLAHDPSLEKVYPSKYPPAKPGALGL